jgi:hypothetical protein
MRDMVNLLKVTRQYTLICTFCTYSMHYAGTMHVPYQRVGWYAVQALHSVVFGAMFIMSVVLWEVNSVNTQRLCYCH